MGCDWNKIGHKETNNSSIKTKYDADIDLEESDDDAAGHNKDIV